MNDENNNINENEPTPPADELTSLRAERDDLLARLQRVSADYLNYQKRVQRDIEETRDFSNVKLIKDILGVLDDLERAIEHARSNHPSDDPLLVGTELVYANALDLLKRHGLQRVNTEGQMFDPNLHEALMRQPTADAPPMTVLSEVQKGYTLKGRTIRPAKVIVAAPPIEPTEPRED
jgi:molecular chaperone GrpE